MNSSEKNDPIRHCLTTADRDVDFEPTQMVDKVLARVEYRRIGMRRLAKAIAGLFAIALVGILPMWLSQFRQTASMARRQVDEQSFAEKAEGNRQVDLKEEIDQQRDRLRELNLEISRLRQIEVEQELVLTGESLSRSVIAQFNSPYPVFIGE